MTAVLDLPELLDTIDPDAGLVQRHLWLISLVAWLRGKGKSVAASHSRLNLLLDALHRAVGLSESIGMVAVVVDAKDEPAARFYRHFNFETFPQSPLTLWLPISVLGKLFPK